MATYNWSVKGSTKVTYINQSITVAISADDVKPSNACYVSLFGNDTTGNGSRKKPFKTLNKAASVLNSSHIMIIGAGVYREKINVTLGNPLFIYGDGDVVMEGTGIGSSWSGYMISQNISFRNYQVVGLFDTYECVNCTFSDMSFESNSISSSLGIKSCTFIRITGIIRVPSTLLVNSFLNNTFIDCRNIIVTNNGNTKSSVWNNIFYNSNIWFSNPSFISYSLFYRCNVRFNASQGTVPSTLYPSVPTGYSTIISLVDLRAAHAIGFPSPIENFIGCAVNDPKFNNVDIGDYSLALDSPAKNLTYLGTYAGSRTIGYPIKAKTTEADGDFDFSSSVNVTIADDSIKMTNDTLLSSIETTVKANLIGREFGRAPVFGFNADRNGQYIDSIADLSGSTISAGSLLTANTPYIVEVGSITYNGSVYLAGERFTTGTELSFTTATSGVCREILEAPQRHTILARFSDGGATKVSGDALTAGYWYYAIGTITYNSVNYTDQVFKAIDTHTISGAGTAREAMTTETYQHYEVNLKFTSNNVGDARTGAIVRGNGDPAYERGSTKEFPINARFIQIKYIIQPNNLRP